MGLRPRGGAPRQRRLTSAQTRQRRLTSAQTNPTPGARPKEASARRGWLIQPRGLVPYDPANAAMHELARRRGADEVPDTLVLLEHSPVYTTGRRSDPAHILWDERRIEEAGAQLRLIDRGGSFTFHGPGQLVGYPVLDLGPRRDVIGYLRNLEEVVIRAAADVGVELGRDPEATGVWAGDRKVCAIGVRVARGRVTLHGFAVNCTTDLGWFEAIVACGLMGRGVASLTQLAGREVTIEEMKPLVAIHFEEVFDTELDPAPPDVAEAFAPRALQPASR